MELSECFLERNKTWLCFLPSCREHFHCKSNQPGTSETWNVSVDSFSSWAPQNSAELQNYLVTSSACAQLSSGKAVLHLVEAQEEMCDLSPSLSSDRSANNIMGCASHPLMTNASISWCQLISACSSGYIKQHELGPSVKKVSGNGLQGSKRAPTSFPCPRNLWGQGTRDPTTA